MNVRIVSAANKFELTDGGYVVIAGVRHWDKVMREAVKPFLDLGLITSTRKHGCEQGFVDNKGNFHTREQAWVVAQKEGQIIRDADDYVGTLFSENLY